MSELPPEFTPSIGGTFHCVRDGGAEVIRVWPGESLHVLAPSLERAEALARHYSRALDLPANYSSPGFPLRPVTPPSS